MTADQRDDTRSSDVYEVQPDEVEPTCDTPFHTHRSVSESRGCARTQVAERAAVSAMLDALWSIHEVDEIGEGYATVNIDYVKVEAAHEAAVKAGFR